ncbi:MAG: AIR synthase family protein [Synergistaceae bacterium]|nr:AIR synthase family protein [Synergistaceae bacterium]
MPGKLQPDILKQKVLNFTGALREDLLVGGGIGEDAALIKVPDGILVAASDPVTGAGKNAGSLLVHINANDVACKGANPSWLIVTLIVPDKLGEKFIENIMREIHETCEKMNIAIAGGHTELNNKYDEPVISGTMLGITRYELSTKKIHDGDLILATGHVGLEGMSIIADDREDLFTGIFTRDELNIIRSWKNNLSVVEPAKILREFSRYMHDPTEGGLNGALYEIQEACNLRLELDDNNIPVSSLTLRASEKLGFNPRNLISSGMLIAVIPPEKISQAQEKLRMQNISSSIIGRFVEGRKISLSANEELWGILAREKSNQVKDDTDE